MQYPSIIQNADPLEVKNLQIMQRNSCIKVEGKFEEDCSTFPCTFKTETRIRCPVYKVKNVFTFQPTPKVCSCDNPSAGIGDVCTNGEPTPWYEPQDIQITKDEDGYCLGNYGYLYPSSDLLANVLPNAYPLCDKKDKRAPFQDCPDCTEGKYL